MPIGGTLRRLLHLLLLVEVMVAASVLSMGIAFGAGRGTATAGQTVSSAQWGSVVVLQGQTATSGALVIDWTNVKKNPYQFIDLVNSSTVALRGQTVSISTTRNGSGNQPLPTIAFALCRAGTWDQTTGACSGTVVDLGSTTTGSITITEPVLVGGRLAVRASTSAGVGSPFTTTFSSAVSRTQARPAVVVNG